MKYLIRAVALVLILAVAASAQTKIRTHKDHSKLVNAAREQGRCALVIFGDGSAGRRAEQARQQLDAEEFKQLVNSYFVFGRLKTNQEEPLWSKYGDKFPADKGPYWMVVTPQLEAVAGGTRDDLTAAGGAWLRRLDQIGKQYPPVGKKDREKAQEMLQQAWDVLQEGQVYDAAKIAALLRETVWFPPSVAQGSERLLNHIQLRGEQALRRARTLREKDPIQAARAYQEIVEQFTTELTPGSQAEQELRRLLVQNPDAAKQLEQFRRQDRAAELLQKAQAEEEKDNPRTATAIYRTITRSYADTESFAPASQALTRLDPNYTPTTQPTTQPTTRPATATTRPAADKPAEDEKTDPEAAAAESLLKMARNLHAAGMDTQAGNKLMECMRKYPDTEAAETAASLYVEWGLQAE